MADTHHGRVRKVTVAGTISTFAGGGPDRVGSDVGDGGPATAAVLPKSLSSGAYLAFDPLHTLAVRSDGTVWAWGGNPYGQLGDATTTERARPTRVAGLTDVVAVTAGAHHSLALKADGSVWAWGWNGVGQLGDGTVIDHRLPAPVPGLTGVKAIAAGTHHNLALTHDGTVWAWGWNHYGQLGTGPAATPETRPVRVPGSAGATAIAAGAAHSLSVRSVGGNIFVWSWGYNGLGQLGDGTTTDRRVPVRSLAQGEDVAAGGYHSFTGTGVSFYGWGYNGLGQLGTGSTAAFVPTPAMVLTPVRLDSIAAGLFQNIALAQDGSVLTWGWNGYGALGDGTLSAHAVPSVIAGPAPGWWRPGPCTASSSGSARSSRVGRLPRGRPSASRGCGWGCRWWRPRSSGRRRRTW